MRKLFLVATSIAIIIPSFAIKPVLKRGKLKADQVMIPVNKTGKMLSLADLSVIKVGELEQLTGQHLNFVQKLAFRSAQHKLKNSIDNDGTINSRKIQKFFKGAVDGEGGFHLGGFALGFFVGLIGVLIAYLIKDDKKHDRVKWAWIGCAIAVALNLILILAVINRA